MASRVPCSRRRESWPRCAPSAAMICEKKHVRVRVAEIDAPRRLGVEAVAAEALREGARRLVAERLAEGEAERGGEPLLQAVPGILHARRGVLLLDDQQPSGADARGGAGGGGGAGSAPPPRGGFLKGTARRAPASRVPGTRSPKRATTSPPSN